MQTGSAPATGTGRVANTVRGTGAPVLVLHGTPGSLEGAEAMARFLPSERFRVVAVARPGYAGTPIVPGHASLDDEADRYAALLDDLGVDRTAVLAWSGGGPSAYHFAARHPDRVSALVVTAGLSGHWVPPHASPAEWFVARTRLGGALAAIAGHVVPRAVVGTVVAGVSSLRGAALRAHVRDVLHDPVRRTTVLDLATSGNAAGTHRAGWENDVRVLGALERLDLGAVRTPTLLLHGDADTDVDPAHSRRALAEVPGAELVTLPGGTHFALWDHADSVAVQQRVAEHLAR